MAVDKRFWGVATIVVTVAVAGAGSLPTLLLRPASLDESATDVAVGAPKPASFNQRAFIAEPAPQPLIAPVRIEAPPQPQPKPAPVQQAAAPPTPAPVQQAAPVALVTPSASPSPVQQAAAVATPAAQAAKPESKPAPQQAASFPPVQPVGEATPTTSSAPTRAASAEPPAKAAKVRRADIQGTVKPRRSARPARFPIREFLAWGR